MRDEDLMEDLKPVTPEYSLFQKLWAVMPSHNGGYELREFMLTGVDGWSNGSMSYCVVPADARPRGLQWQSDPISLPPGRMSTTREGAVNSFVNGLVADQMKASSESAARIKKVMDLLNPSAPPKDEENGQPE